MSMADLAEGLRIIEAHPDKGFFAGPRPPELVAAAEAALGEPFPPTYREFVSRLGAGNFGAAEFYGVTTANFQNSRVPNGIWLTLDERRARALPRNRLVIGSVGDGSFYCLRLAGAGEAPVVVLDPGAAASSVEEVVAADFGEFFLEEIRQQLER